MLGWARRKRDAASAGADGAAKEAVPDVAQVVASALAAQEARFASAVAGLEQRYAATVAQLEVRLAAAETRVLVPDPGLVARVATLEVEVPKLGNRFNSLQGVVYRQERKQKEDGPAGLTPSTGSGVGLYG